MRAVSALLGVLGASVSAASATVLSFEEFGDHAIICDDYGDLIIGNIVRDFPYRIEAEGTTPDVFVGFEDTLRVQNNVFGDGNGAAVETSGDGDITFGFSGLLRPKQVMVQLYDFVLYSSSGVLEDIIIEVYDETCEKVFSGTYQVTEEGTRVSFERGMNMFLTGHALDVSIRGLNSFDTAKIGIDDIRFGELADNPIPVPAAALFMATGLLGAGVRKRLK